jgi:hypothetical protein
MRCLDIVWVIIPPRSSHPFRLSVVWHDVIVIRELFVTDRAFPVLLDNLPIQQFPHFSEGPEFPISPRMMRILNASNPRLQSARIGRLFPTAAGERSVDRAVFIPTKPHDISSNGTSVKSVVGAANETVSAQMGCYNACPRGTMTNLTGIIRKLRKEKQRVHGEMEHLNAALAALGSLGGLERKCKGSRMPKVRRPMSAAARKKIAAAQRARWARWKKNKRTN